MTDVGDRIQKVKDAYDEERRQIESEEDDELCRLCKTVNSDRVEDIQSEESGEMITVPLCEHCWQKIRRYDAGEDVDFDRELRLRERSVDTGTEQVEGES